MSTLKARPTPGRPDAQAAPRAGTQRTPGDRAGTGRGRCAANQAVAARGRIGRCRRRDRRRPARLRRHRRKAHQARQRRGNGCQQRSHDTAGRHPADRQRARPPTAPVTLQYFGDLECPVCRAFTIGALPSVIGKWVRGGQLKVEYRSLETATREPEVFRSQQVAALAAGRQNRMWNFVETFYHEQGEEDTGYVTENFIQGIAKQVPGLNLTAWTSERGEPGAVKPAGKRRAGGQQQWPRRHTGVPARTLRDCTHTVRAELVHRTEPVRRSDRKARQELGRERRSSDER
jgi:hypothetical protein